MSKYTTQVRFICESESGLRESKGFNNVNDIIEASYDKIFNFDYPIFDENYRKPLECKILRNFYTREICEETVGLWKLRLQQKLNEIMPYYNQLYNSELLSFNPFYDVDLTRDHVRTDDGTNDTINNGTSKENHNDNDVNWNYYSDTPQGDVNGITALKYLTNLTKNTNDNVGGSTGETSNKGNTKIHNVEDYLEHVKGKQGTTSYSKMLKEFRETFLNIDQMILNDLEPLFFGLWQ